MGAGAVATAAPTIRKRARDDRPGHVQDWLRERAKAKRHRRAAKPHASNYAKANGALG